MRSLVVAVALLALLAGCEQNIGATGPSSGSERPSIVSACSEGPTGLASTPQPTHHKGDRPIIINVPPQPAPVVNIPREDRPTINCTRGGGAGEAD